MFVGLCVRQSWTQASGAPSKLILFACQISNGRSISPELEVLFWEYQKYLNPNEAGPPLLIPISLVRSQACRVAVFKYPKRLDAEESDEEGYSSGRRVGAATRVWATVGLTRVSESFLLIFYCTITD